MLFKLDQLEEAIVREWYMSSVDRSAGDTDLYMFHPLLEYRSRSDKLCIPSYGRLGFFL